MKHKAIPCSVPRQPLYPNAADANYFTEKALEILAAMLSGTAFIAFMVFLVSMA